MLSLWGVNRDTCEKHPSIWSFSGCCLHQAESIALFNLLSWLLWRVLGQGEEEGRLSISGLWHMCESTASSGDPGQSLGPIASDCPMRTSVIASWHRESRRIFCSTSWRMKLVALPDWESRELPCRCLAQPTWLPSLASNARLTRILSIAIRDSQRIFDDKRIPRVIYQL